MYWTHKVKLKFGVDPISLELTILNLKEVENYLPLQSVCKRERVRTMIFCVCLQMLDGAGQTGPFI